MVFFWKVFLIISFFFLSFFFLSFLLSFFFLSSSWLQPPFPLQLVRQLRLTTRSLVTPPLPQVRHLTKIQKGAATYRKVEKTRELAMQVLMAGIAIQRPRRFIPSIGNGLPPLPIRTSTPLGLERPSAIACLPECASAHGPSPIGHAIF